VNGEDIPQSVRSFIFEQIHSVGELEALLLFAAQADREWTSEQLARELRISVQWAEQQIADLAGRGLVEIFPGNPPHCHYAPRDQTMARTVGELAGVYASRRVAVIQLIYAKPTDPVQSFADAFRFRKGKDNG
jgi:hypothetical protein